jgi:hypothetical protein
MLATRKTEGNSVTRGEAEEHVVVDALGGETCFECITRRAP